MDANLGAFLQTELVERRERLHAALTMDRGGQISSLLKEVDLALDRIKTGTYGLCEVCHEDIEKERLLANPLACLCLEHMTKGEQRALEQDLELASVIQRGLLPDASRPFGPWDIGFSFQPAGLVSGDYLDVIPGRMGEILFLLGDVSGKGVAASMLMSQLHGMFRTLATVDLPLPALMERAGRMFCESTLPNHYATLISGRAFSDGRVEICNAGHLPALLVRPGVIESFGSSSLPLGLFCEGGFQVEQLHLNKRDRLLLFSDGYTEAENPKGKMFGRAGMETAILEIQDQPSAQAVRTLRSRLELFQEGKPSRDDCTLMILTFHP